jgi:hypothetical protein
MLQEQSCGFCGACAGCGYYPPEFKVYIACCLYGRAAERGKTLIIIWGRAGCGYRQGV